MNVEVIIGVCRDAHSNITASTSKCADNSHIKLGAHLICCLAQKEDYKALVFHE